VTRIDQTLDLWTGILQSRFEFEGQLVLVTTACHSDLDALGIRIESSLVNTAKLGVRIAFGFGSPEIDMFDVNSPDKHQTVFEKSDSIVHFTRTLDNDHYSAAVSWSTGQLDQTAKHEFVITGGQGDRLEIVTLFTPQSRAGAIPHIDEVFKSSESSWEKFWLSGAAIDLSDSTDSRAAELERRIVLSQYNTALHCAGPHAAAETGLLFNSWYGKSHLEMHWWHGVHFAAWNRFELLERSLGFLPADYARRQSHRRAPGI
jgi:hypothetical protein